MDSEEIGEGQRAGSIGSGLSLGKCMECNARPLKTCPTESASEEIVQRIHRDPDQRGDSAQYSAQSSMTGDTPAHSTPGSFRRALEQTAPEGAPDKPSVPKAYQSSRPNVDELSYLSVICNQHDSCLLQRA